MATHDNNKAVTQTSQQTSNQHMKKVRTDNQRVFAGKQKPSTQACSYTECLDVQPDMLNDGVSGIGTACFTGDILQPTISACSLNTASFVAQNSTLYQIL